MKIALVALAAALLVGCSAKIGLNNDFKIPIFAGAHIEINIGKDEPR